MNRIAKVFKKIDYKAEHKKYKALYEDALDNNMLIEMDNKKLREENEKLRRENFGMRETIKYFKEKEEKRYNAIR